MSLNPIITGQPNQPLTLDSEQNEPLILLKTMGNVSDKMFFHVQANEFGKNNPPWEGYSKADTLTYLHTFLSKRLDQKASIYGLSKETLKEIETAIKLTNDFALHAHDSIEEAFSTNHPILLPGGWAGSPGHAIYYEIIPGPNSKATFRIFNLGSGLEYHATGIVGNKQKSIPYIDFEGVLKEALLDQNILKAMEELITHLFYPGTNNQTAYNELDIYEGLKAILKPENVLLHETEISPEIVKTTQYCGICSWRSLLAFLSTKMTKKNYKKFICAIKMQNMTDYYHSTGVFGPSIQQRRVIYKSHQKLSRTIARAYEKSIIGQRYLGTAQYELDTIEKWLDNHKNPFLIASKIKPLQDRVKTPHLCWEPSNLDSLPALEIHEGLAHQLSTAEKPNNAQPCTFIFDRVRNMTDIDHLLTLAEEAVLSKQYQALNLAIIDFMNRFDRDQYLQSLGDNLDSAKKSMISIGRLAQLFFTSCLYVTDAHVIHPERIVVFMKLLHMQKLLGLKIKPEHPELFVLDLGFLKRNSINAFGFRNDIKSKVYLKITDKKLQSEFLSLCPTGSEEPLFRFHMNYLKNSGQSCEIDAEEESAKKFLNCFSEILPLMNGDVLGFSIMNPMEQWPYLYASDKLPDWFRAMRSTHLFLFYFTHDFVATPPNNQPIDVSPVLDRKPNQCLFGIKGISGAWLNYFPELKLIREEHHQQFFRPLYRPFQSSVMTRLFELFTWEGEEKKLLIFHASNEGIELADEIFKQILHIRVNKQQTQIAESFAFFTKYPTKLGDPDYQILFVILFFEMNLLTEEMTLPGFSRSLGEFMQNQYSNYSLSGDIPTSVFLLRMICLFKDFAVEDKDLFEGTLEKLHSLLGRDGLDPEEKSIIFTEIASEISKKNDLSEQELMDLLTASLHLSEIPVPKKSMDPQADKEARDSIHIHAKEIHQFLVDKEGQANQRALNTLLKSMLSLDRSNWRIVEEKGSFPSFVSEGEPCVIYYPLIGRLVIKDKEIALPLEIREHPHFRQLFPEKKRAIIRDNNIYEFIDSFGTQTLLKKNHNELIIEQKEGTEWYRFLPRDTLMNSKAFSKEIQCHLFSRHLVHDFHHWIPVIQPSLIKITNPSNGKREYTVVIDRNNNKPKLMNPTRVNDQAVLNQTNKECLFSNFEHPSYIQEWYKKTGSEWELKQIELPRFGLSFSYDKATNKLFCDQFKKQGFYLSAQKLDPVFHSCKHFLILQDDDGEKKVLLPALQHEKTLSFVSLEPKYTIDFHLAPEDLRKQKYYTFQVNKEGHLTSHSKPANLYLSYTLTVFQEYETAAKYLKNFGPKVSLYTKEEEEILNQIIALPKFTGDMNGDSIAIRTYAAYLLLKNNIDYNLKISPLLFLDVRDLMEDYLAHYRNITAIKLSDEEECFLLQFVLQKMDNTRLYRRWSQLDPVGALEYTKPQKQIQSTAKSSSDIMTYRLILEKCPPGYDIPKDLLITRMSLWVECQFLIFYKIAKSGTEQEKKRLWDGLFFSLPRKDIREFGNRKIIALCYLLECVINNPDKFPNAPNSRDGQWWNEVLKIADELGSDKLSAFFNKQSSEPPVPDITPADFQLESKVIPKPSSFEVEYHTTTTLTSWNELCKACFKSDDGKESSGIQHGGSNGDSFKKWLETEANAPLSTDPLYAKEIKKLLVEASIPELQSSPVNFTFTDHGQVTLEMILKKDKEEKEKEIKNLLEKIIDEANCPPSDNQELRLYQLKRMGRTDKNIALDELLIFYARKDISGLLARNPRLDQTKVNQLFDIIGKYLLLATHEQQRERALKELEKVKKCSSVEEKNDLIQQLGEVISAKREYKPKEHPAYLVFEYSANILLRKAQKKKLKAFLTSGKVNPVMEMIMGSGKSKVLLPLLGLLRADGITLSMVIVPQPLLEDVATDAQKALYDLGQSLHVLHFDRNTPITKNSLKVILEGLKSVQKNKNCLIMTSKSVQCLLLKCIETCNDYLPKGLYPEELQLMQEILSLIHAKGHPLIDEADTILNVLHEVCFSLGNRASVNQDEVKLISTLYEMLYTDPELKALARLDSDVSANSKAQVLTEELYHGKIKELFAKKFMGSIQQEIQAFAKLSIEDVQLAVDYLTRNKKTIKEAQMFYDKQNDRVKNILALAAEEISNFLPHTLSKVCDEKYGLDSNKNGVLAIPYAAANTPNSGSQFANPYITINYTLQYYNKKNITPEIMHQQIERLQNQAIQELKDDSTLQLKDTKAWQIFAKLKGDLDIPLFNFKMGDIDRLIDSLNSHTDRKRQFVTEVILPQLELFTHKISSNPHNLISLFLKAAGFTGTLWNSDSMHSMLHAKPEPGTDINTIRVLWKNSRDEVVTINEGDPEAMLTQMQSNGLNYDLISDAGGYFKKGGNLEIARKMADTLGKPVVFYHKNEQTETNGKSETLLAESETPIDGRYTFLDQSHTTGADVKQKPNGVGIVTIGRNMLLRDLLQAVWRMRGIEKSQRIKFVVSKEVESIIRQKINKPEKASDGEGEGNSNKIEFEDILRFTLINQVKQQGTNNFKGLREELASELQNILLQVLYNLGFSKEEKIVVYKKLSDTWIKNAILEPKDLYGTIVEEVNASKVLKREKKKFQKILDKVYEDLPFLEEKGLQKTVIETRVANLFQIREKSLPAKIGVPLRDIDSDQTIEQEIKQEREAELEVVQNLQDETHKTLGVKLGKLVKCESLVQDIFSREGSETPYFTMSAYCHHDPVLKEFSEAFEGINLTLNVPEWPEQNPRLEDLQFLGNCRTPLHFVLVGEKDELIVLNNDDTVAIKLFGEKNKLYHLTLGFYDKSIKVPLKLVEQVVKLKFLDGVSTYTKTELEILEKWFKEIGVEKMLNLYQKHILSGFPLKAADYSQSNLRKLFLKLTKKEIDRQSIKG